eukprot:TRINITY_DN33718_c0_g1_i2.p1 TRINITY_DN33718_c0_g1~~TRINITY_DN33718_c0_g1_i2.p1  ORF type:complete len:102 (-),score=2.33 TRINITY_DN33718_c0_g1_i2:1215-1520(-)
MNLEYKQRLECFFSVCFPLSDVYEHAFIMWILLYDSKLQSLFFQSIHFIGNLIISNCLEVTCLKFICLSFHQLSNTSPDLNTVLVTKNQKRKKRISLVFMK